MSTDAGDDADGETVLTFGGNGGEVYHRPLRVDGALRPWCGAPGRNPLEKRRELIEAFYRPCRRCFPGAGGDDV